jgi:hypothetical protein
LQDRRPYLPRFRWPERRRSRAHQQGARTGKGETRRQVSCLQRCRPSLTRSSTALTAGTDRVPELPVDRRGRCHGRVHRAIHCGRSAGALLLIRPVAMAHTIFVLLPFSVPALLPLPRLAPFLPLCLFSSSSCFLCLSGCSASSPPPCLRRAVSHAERPCGSLCRNTPRVAAYGRLGSRLSSSASIRTERPVCTKPNQRGPTRPGRYYEPPVLR